jgi:hypothetical protein
MRSCHEIDEISLNDAMTWYELNNRLEINAL